MASSRLEVTMKRNKEVVMSERFAVILESGTMDKLMAASILTAGAAAMGKEVTVFLTFGGLNAFKKGAKDAKMIMPDEFAGMETQMAHLMNKKQVPHWLTNFESAAELGNVKVLACSATMELFDMKLQDLEPIVEEVVGVAHFIQQSEGAQTVFI
jgi:peroxiredoxin family protein